VIAAASHVSLSALSFVASGGGSRE